MDAEEAKARCTALVGLIRSLPASKISPSSKQTLLRLVHAELRFLSRLTSPRPVSPNVAHLAALLRALRHPAVSHVSRACRPAPSSSSSHPVHVDAVCALGASPAWLLVSARNPRYLPWRGTLKTRVEQLLDAARNAPLALRPALILLVFATGVGDGVASGLVHEFGAAEIDFFGDPDVFEELEDGWVSVKPAEDFERARVFEIRIGSGCDERVAELGRLESGDGVPCECGGDAFGSLISSMRLSSVDMINFDTTALIAMVSGISNGAAERLLKAPENETRARFKGNYEFVIAQVMSELQHPILAELEAVTDGKKCIICESVCSEFKELVSMCGGPNEKLRAEQLIKCLLVVPDSPSTRVMDLPTTRKIALKNKIVFGTGDYWHAPTLTANVGFVRAISQTGMSLLTIEHRPRALTGD